MPGDLAGHRFTRPEGLVQYEYEWMLIVWPPGTYPGSPGAKLEKPKGVAISVK